MKYDNFTELNMILDKTTNLYKYIQMHPAFAVVNEYLVSHDLKSLAPGNYIIEEDRLFVIVAEAYPNPDAAPKIEAHRKYIDIQIALQGSFNIGWKALNECKTIFSDYDLENEFIFYDDDENFKMTLSENTFAIFYPMDGHKVYPPDTYVKKAVFKVLIDY